MHPAKRRQWRHRSCGANGAGDHQTTWAKGKVKHVQHPFGFFVCFVSYVLYFLNLIFILCWSIVDLYCCVSFRGTAKWFSYTYIHSISDSFHIKITTEYSVYFSVLYHRSLLANYFMYNHVCSSQAPDLSLPSPTSVCF